MIPLALACGHCGSINTQVLADLQVAGGAAGPDTVGAAAKENAPGTTGATAAGDAEEPKKTAKK